MSLKDTVIGHRIQKMILQRSLKRGRLSSTYLFSGEPGTGKALLAKEFVKVLFCESPVVGEDGPDSCDTCNQCLKVDHGNHPDLLTLTPEGQQIKIGQVREAQEYISVRPLEAPKRVLIVDEAELMNEP
ncbi:MAG: ATPase, partial [Nitrospirae bacterium]